MFSEGPLSGVNLGGWLVLEKWITPSLFEGLKAVDEYGFCEELGPEAAAKLRQHRDNFINDDDFKWLRRRGMQAIRLPVGYWLFGDQPPFLGAIDYVDFCFEQAELNGLKLVLDLHGARGSQNGRDHSGRAGEVAWHLDPGNIDQSLLVITRLAERYRGSNALMGIELLNEPARQIPLDVLKDYYHRGYAAVTDIAGRGVNVIISDGFEPDRWVGVMPQSRYPQLVIDMHLYQLFGEEDKRLDLEGHIEKCLGQWSPEIGRLQRFNRVIIGEWSCQLPGLDDDTAARRYSRAQLAVFDQSAAWFYWTYKAEASHYWSFRDCWPTIRQE